MPRTYPEDPAFPEDGGAERRVWESQRDHLPDHVVLFGAGLPGRGLLVSGGSYQLVQVPVP